MLEGKGYVSHGAEHRPQTAKLINNGCASAMNKDLSAIVADNMNALVRVRGEDTVTLSRKAGISQKTVWNVLRYEQCNRRYGFWEA